MRVLAVAAALAALAACGPRENVSSLDQPCAGAASRAWDAGADTLIISAMATGPTCASASADIKVVDDQNQTLFQQAYPVEHVMVLVGAANAADLQTKLEQWIADAPRTSGALPDWPEGAEQPMSGEFPFYPSKGVTREIYLAARAANAPMWCFVQGMESQACLVLRAGTITNLGAQSFPG